MMRGLARFVLAGAMALGAGVAQAQETEAHRRALAAGYQAAFTCSGVFNNNGRHPSLLTNRELSGVYPELRPYIGIEGSLIDPRASTVSVSFSDDLPPRIAFWRPGLGCALLPIGASAEAAAHVPKLTILPPRRLAVRWARGSAEVIPEKDALNSDVMAVVEKAFSASYGDKAATSAVVVVKDGEIIAERYAENFGPEIAQRTWSVGKSIAATVIGIAVEDGVLKVEDPAPISHWRKAGDPRGAITLANLLHMGSGLYSEARGNRTDAIYHGGTTVEEKAIGMPLEAKPGARFRYANNDTLLAMRALRKAIGDDAKYLAFPFEKLFWKIGMIHTFAETDWNGDFIMSSQVWTTARDLARFGQLYLQEGKWGEEQILPKAWIDFVRTPAPAQPQSAIEGDGPAYGAQFWLHGPKQGLPEGTYAAHGNRGQYVVIVPEANMVIVRRGYDPVGEGGGFDIQRFAADVIAASRLE